MKSPIVLVAALVAACSTTPATEPGSASAGASAPSSSMSEARVAEAVSTPLTDFNLVQAEIPPALVEARKGPYAALPEPNCAALAVEVQKLDAVLGTDLDAPPTSSNPGLVERGGEAIGDAAVGAIRGAAEGVVPFRGWIRKITGAERYSREVAAAIAAGTVRRAYLKGVGQAIGCQSPAAPLRTAATR